MGTSTIRILTVCTANICRSPFAADRLLDSLEAPLADLGLAVEMGSAGIVARPGMPACGHLWTAAGFGFPEDHSSRLATPELVAQADLVLGLAANHTASLATLAPGARGKTFTLEDAAALAGAIAGPRHALYWAQADQGEVATLDPLDPLARVPSLPHGTAARLAWLIGEMDAWRGTVPRIATGSVDDPHESEVEIHPAVADQIAELSSLLGVSIARALAA